MKNRRYSRRLIVKDFQRRFVLVNLFFVCLALLAFVILLFGPMLPALFDSNVPFEEQALVAATFLGLHGRVWLALAVVLLGGLLHLSIVSHRVAGPLVRINRIIRAAGAGDVSMRVKVRSTDYLQEEAASLDRMFLCLRRKIGAAKGRSNRLEAALHELRSAIAHGSDDTAPRALEAVEEHARRLQEHLETFRTVPKVPTVVHLEPPKAPEPEALDQPATARRA
jgi:methyl-accepting chemotaxis protein